MAENVSKFETLVILFLKSVSSLSPHSLLGFCRKVLRCLEASAHLAVAVGGLELTAPVTPRAIDSGVLLTASSCFFLPPPPPLHLPPFLLSGAWVEMEGLHNTLITGQAKVPCETETFLSDILTGHSGFSSPPSKVLMYS